MLRRSTIVVAAAVAAALPALALPPPALPVLALVRGEMLPRPPALTPSKARPTLARSPVLRLAPTKPLTVLGERFAPQERVTLRVSAVGAARAVVRARADGSFRKSFPALRTDKCVGLVVLATGAAGNKASLRLQPLACQPST